MRLKWRGSFGLSCVAGLAAAAIGLAITAHASTTHYYYDPQGRLLGAMSSGAEQRTSRSDNADNPTYLHIFPATPPSNPSTLTPYSALVADQMLTSADGRFTFQVQEDGNAVIYNGSNPLWSTGTPGHQPGWFTLDGSGNLDYYDPSDNLLWNVAISGGTAQNAQLVMQSDGNLVLYQNGKAVWASGTGGH